jgi:hypothetical protein
MAAVRLTLSPADRFGHESRPDGGGKFLPRLLVYGFVVPFTVVALAASGWYIGTGELPTDLLNRLAGSSRVSMPMPPRLGPEKPSTSLLRPPAANDPDVKMSMAPVPEVKPSAPAQPDAAAKPVNPPAVPDATKAATPAPAGPVATLTEPPPPPALSEPLIPPGGEPLAPPAFSQLPARTDLKPLPPAPLPELIRVAGGGALPVVTGGKEPRTAYARPFDGDKSKPRVAVVVVGLGLSKDATEAAIAKLPPEVSLSFSPYASNLDNWVKRARNNGHEVLLDLPMQPPNFPEHDAGPLALMVNQTPVDAVQHLEAILGKTTSYVGLAGALRSPVTTTEQWVSLLRDIRDRGLLFVGDGLVGVAETDAPASASVTLVADEVSFRAAIDVRLTRLQAAAQRDGTAIAYVSPRPVTFERLLAWTDTLPQKGLVLAPASAVIRPQP